MSKFWYYNKSTKQYMSAEGTTCDKPKPGYYIMSEDNFTGNLLLNTIDVKNEEIIPFDDGSAVEVLNEINNFNNSIKLYETLGFHYKRGVLLYGPQGTGKSTIVRQTINNIISSSAYAFSYTEQNPVTTSLMKSFREFYKGLILVVIEDVDSIRYEEDLLELMDGNSEISNNTMFLGTTNHIHDVPDRLKNRPGRFDRKILFEKLSENHRYKLLYNWTKNEKLANKLADISDNFTVAMLKELVLQELVYSSNMKYTLERLKSISPEAEEE